MAKIVTYFNLFPIPDPQEFLGIAADNDEDNVITTLARNIVVILKISTQKQIRSWSVLEKLSSRVVFDRLSQKYVGVFGHHALRVWDESVLDINKCKKLKFQKSIAAVVSDRMDDEALVLYSDGTSETLSTALALRKEQNEDSEAQMALITGQTYSKARLCTLADGQKLLTYFRRDKNSGKLCLVRISLATGETLSYPVSRDQVEVSGYAVIEGENAPMLLTIWSDKRIFMLSLAHGVSTNSSPGNYVSMLTELNVKNSISVLGISRHSVAIYGANHGQEGSSLLLYNTQFKVVKAKQFFKVFFDFSRLWATNEHILLAMGQNISIVTYHMSKEVLADLLGSQNNNEIFNPIEFDHINEDEALEQSLKFVANNDNQLSSAKEKPLKSQQQYSKANDKIVPFESIDDFNCDLNAISNSQIDVEILEIEQALEDAQLEIMSSFNDGGTQDAVVQMILRQMEWCGASEQEITEKLLKVLIRTDQPLQILMCLKRYTNITEKNIAMTLIYALSKCKSAYQSTKSNVFTTGVNAQICMNQSVNEISVPTSEYPNVDLLLPNYYYMESDSPFQLLNAVLACSFDSKIIAEHLRHEMEYDAIILLLRHLYIILNDSSSIFKENACREPHCIQFEMHVFRWFGVLLSAHFQRLALAKDLDLLNLLFDWQKVLTLYKEELGELEKVAALLSKLLQKRTIERDNTVSKWYSIEEVMLY